MSMDQTYDSTNLGQDSANVYTLNSFSLTLR
jgi:hypothetical protein